MQFITSSTLVLVCEIGAVLILPSPPRRCTKSKQLMYRPLPHVHSRFALSVADHSLSLSEIQSTSAHHPPATPDIRQRAKMLATHLAAHLCALQHHTQLHHVAAAFGHANLAVKLLHTPRATHDDQEQPDLRLVLAARHCGLQ